MSKRTFYAAFCLGLFGFVLSPNVFAQSCRLSIGDDGDSELWLEGTLGDSTVRVYFSTEPDGQLKGSFYDVSNWSPVSLEGIRGEDCKFRIVEGRDGRRDAIWDGIFRNRVFEGTRRSFGSGEGAAIRLQRVPPMDCDGKGKWIRFDVPEFGTSFEYPESWRIAERSGANIRLVCPDPRAFLESGVSIKSAGVPDKTTQIGIFSKSQGKWLVTSADAGGSCELLSAFCTEARLSRQSGMTVVHGSGARRLYISGGPYQGLGDEEAYLLLLKDASLYVSSVFVKESTTARIVRSVKPISGTPR
jgi:hypothetical protein